MEVLSNPAVITLIAAIPAVTLAVIGYKQAIRLDARAEELGAANIRIDVILEENKTLKMRAAVAKGVATETALDRTASATERLADTAENFSNGKPS